MDNLLSILGFSLGATLGAGVVRSVSGGWRPLVGQGFKAGLAVRDFLGTAKDGLASATSGARSSLGHLRDEAAAAQARRARAQTQKIEVVQD